MTLFGLCKIYIASSEIEVNTGYIDIVLKKDLRYKKEVKWEWMVELKYLKTSSKQGLKAKKKGGKEQIKKYLQSRGKARLFTGENIKKVLLIIKGKKKVIWEYM